MLCVIATIQKDGLTGGTVECPVCRCKWECDTVCKCTACEKNTLCDTLGGEDNATCLECLTLGGDGVNHYSGGCDGPPDPPSSDDDESDDAPDVNAAIESALTHAPNVKSALTAYLRALGLFHDVNLYDQAAWEARKEHVGNGAVCSMTAEGPFNHVWNYPQGAWDIEAARGFTSVVERMGLHLECGFAWSFHFYRLNDRASDQV